MSVAAELARLAERLREGRDARALARAVQLDRPTLVLGSAPRPELPPGWNRADPLLTINASQVSAEMLGLGEPTLTVLSVTLLGTLPTNREAQRVLAGRRTRHLLVVSHPEEWARDAHVLADIGYVAGATSRITTRFRNRVVRAATGADAGRGDPNTVKVSNGIYAICQAIALGAPQVVVAGFSLRRAGGHAYNDLGAARLHVDPDTRAFAALAARHDHVFAATPELGAELGLPAWPRT